MGVGVARANRATGQGSCGDDLWVFAYGSLMWRPSFAHSEHQTAMLRGFHRSLCVYSHFHRGTPDQPGLVMGLDRGGSCKGLAYRVRSADAETTIAYLREREQVTSVYVEKLLPIRLADGRQTVALAYTIDTAHRQYAGRLERETALELVRDAQGVSGPNPDYVLRTHEQMLALGIKDMSLAWLAQRLTSQPSA